jgi:hypothetical protein
MSIRDWLLIGCLLLIVFALGCWIGERDRPPKKPKKNVRVPRETLWTRTNRFHGDTQ